MDCLSDELGDILNNLGGITGRNFGKPVAVRIQPTSFTQRYTRILRGKQDNKSVLDLPTPLELYKMGHTAEEYDELVSFYSSDAWKEIEREHLNSDRRYYEKRKALIDPEEKEVATKKKYYDPEPFQLRAEEKFTNGLDDLFDDPVLQSCYRELTERQQEVIRMFFCEGMDTIGIARVLRTGVRNVQKIKKRALEKLKTLYAKTTILAAYFGYSKLIPYNHSIRCIL